MLMTLKQNIFQRKIMGERVQEFNRSFRKIKFSQFLGDCYHKLSQFFDTPRRMFTVITRRIRYPVELNRIHSSCH